MKTVEAMVGEARARIREFTVAEVKAMDPERTVIVDIRDIRERAKGHIPGSVHAPRGMLEFWWDPTSPYHRDIFAQNDKTYVLHCAMGWRSALAADTLTQMGFDVAHMDGGMKDWTETDGPVEIPKS